MIGRLNFRLVTTSQVLFFINSGIWFALGVMSLFRLANDRPGSTITPVVLGTLMFGNAIAMLVSGLCIGIRQKRFFYLALAVLVVNILLTVTDQFGIIDFITLAIDLGLMVIMVLTWHQYTS